ncbi:hypothetical protein EVA_19122 [gut metagenome]|uniref:Uncharacterized protein n=1 Tax=gut metagenome TaxID=749906 RepID=J9FT71_9ZZZZ
MNFARKELLYDIKNYAYIEGHIMEGERQHAKHMLVDIGEDGNVDRVTRILNLVHAAVVELLYPYTKEEPITEEMNDALTEPENYVIQMKIPKTFSKTSITLLARLIHEYMVYRVLSDWLSIINPSAAEHWQSKYKEAEMQISSIKNHRKKALTRPLNPF